MSHDTEMHPRRHDDEIDLADLVASIWRRKWLVLAVMLVCMLLGIGYALTKATAYEYSTTIEIGTRVVDGETQPIERPQTVVAKLEKNYVPEAIRTFEQERKNNGGRDVGLKVSAQSPENTNLVLLSSQGTEELGKYYIPLHNRVLQRLSMDHERQTELQRLEIRNKLLIARQELERVTDERVLRVERNELQTKISAARNELEQLKDQAELINAEIENLDVQEDLIRSRLEELSEFVKRARDRRASAQMEVSGGTDSMALMLIDNELQRDIDRRTELEERLLVALPDSRATLRNQLEENQRAQTLQQEAIGALEARYEKLLLDQEREVPRAEAEVAEVQAQLDSLRETQAVLPPQRSIEPVGTSPNMTIALSVILGIVFGLFVALVSIFAKSVREHLSKKATR